MGASVARRLAPARVRVFGSSVLECKVPRTQTSQTWARSSSHLLRQRCRLSSSRQCPGRIQGELFLVLSRSTLTECATLQDLVHHQERIEAIISEMLAQIPQITSQAHRCPAKPCAILAMKSCRAKGSQTGAAWSQDAATAREHATEAHGRPTATRVAEAAWLDRQLPATVWKRDRLPHLTACRTGSESVLLAMLTMDKLNQYGRRR